MGAPGVRLALAPVNWLTYQGAVFQGNVFAQNLNQHGFRWDLSASNGYFSIHELIFRTNQGAGANGLPGEFKIGGWFDTAADPNVASHPWNYGFYFIVDQMLYRVPKPDSAHAVDNNGTQTLAAPSTEKGLGIYTHIGFAPRNSSLMNFYIDGGINYKGLIPTRDNDVLGVAFAYGHLSHNPQNNDGSSFPGYEIVLEATYQMELTPWLTFQPDLQYVIHPSGTDIANALVLGAQATVSF
jgi:porin